MRAWGGHHVVAGYRGGTSVRWCRVAAATVAAVLPLAVCVAAAVPASAAGGYTVIATIDVGGGPDGVAVDSAVHTAYVTNINDDSVSVIDEATNAVTNTIGVGGGPFAVAVDSADHTAYVTNGGNGTVSVIDETTGAVTATIKVGAGPDGVAVDSSAHTAYVANGGARTVSVIDEAKGTVTATIHVGSDPSAVAVDPTTHTAYVTNLVGDSVSVIDETTGAVTATIKVGAGPDGVAVDSSAHTAYVANGGAGTVSVIDEAKGTVTATIHAGSDPSAVAVDPTTHTAYVTNLGGTVSVIDETTGAVAATVPVGSDPDGVAVNPTAHTAYVTNENTSTVSVIGIIKPVLPVTTATSSRNPGSFGQSVTFTAKVGPVDGGTITFSNGTTALCRAVSLTHVSGSTYHATCTTSTLPAGRDKITAVYPGDASYAASTGTLTQTVNRATTALTVSVGLTPPWGAFILTAKLTVSGRPLSGQPVSFSTGVTRMCTQKASTLGVATCVLTGPEVVLAAKGKGAIRASYPGSASYLPASAATVLPGFP